MSDPVMVGAFREPLDWAALARRARAQGVALQVLFPSHVPEVFEASTGAYGRFAEVERGLARLGIEAVRDRALVRGLDYYRHTIFEFVARPAGGEAHSALVCTVTTEKK